MFRLLIPFLSIFITVVAQGAENPKSAPTPAPNKDAVSPIKGTESSHEGIEAPESPPQSGQSDAGDSKEPKVEGDTPSEQAPTGDTPKSQIPQPIERSPISLKLEKRLSLSTAFSLNSISATGGTFSSGSNGEIGLEWRLQKYPRLLIGLKYVPIDFTLKKNTRTYRGVLQGLFFGSQMFYPMRTSAILHSGVDFFYFNCQLRSADSLPVSKGDCKNGGGLTVSGGTQWTVLENLGLGPSLTLGIGSYKIVQITIRTTFFF